MFCVIILGLLCTQAHCILLSLPNNDIPKTKTKNSPQYPFCIFFPSILNASRGVHSPSLWIRNMQSSFTLDRFHSYTPQKPKQPPHPPPPQTSSSPSPVIVSPPSVIVPPPKSKPPPSSSSSNFYSFAQKTSFHTYHPYAGPPASNTTKSTTTNAPKTRYSNGRNCTFEGPIIHVNPRPAVPHTLNHHDIPFQHHHRHAHTPSFPNHLPFHHQPRSFPGDLREKTHPIHKLPHSKKIQRGRVTRVPASEQYIHPAPQSSQVRHHHQQQTNNYIDPQSSQMSRIIIQQKVQELYHECQKANCDIAILYQFAPSGGPGRPPQVRMYFSCSPSTLRIFFDRICESVVALLTRSKG